MGSKGKLSRHALPGNTKFPYLGLCLGMQVMCIETARALFQSG
ncbi:MAG: hypothetical protein R2867_28420 [Caldilineaceae bacterium]